MTRPELRDWVERHCRAFARAQSLASEYKPGVKIKISMTPEDAKAFAANLKALIDLADPTTN